MHLVQWLGIILWRWAAWVSWPLWTLRRRPRWWWPESRLGIQRCILVNPEDFHVLSDPMRRLTSSGSNRLKNNLNKKFLKFFLQFFCGISGQWLSWRTRNLWKCQYHQRWWKSLPNPCQCPKYQIKSQRIHQHFDFGRCEFARQWNLYLPGSQEWFHIFNIQVSNSFCNIR